MSLVAAVDLGTTTVRVGLFDGDEREAISRQALGMTLPFPGAVEQDPDELVRAVVGLLASAMRSADVTIDDISAIGIANQRATIVCWSAGTGRALRPAVGWQDTRSADEVARLVARGIPVTTSASCTKMRWLLDNDPVVAAASADGTLRMGTVDSWLTWALSQGAVRVTDPGNAAATGLYDPRVGDWSDGALELFGVPREPLPGIVASDARVGPATLLGPSVELAARLGDQMAACAAHHLVAGEAKLTLGTSGMLDVHTGREPAPAPDGCYTLPLWRRSINGEEVEEYMFEGSVNTAGSVVEWLVGVGLLTDVTDLDSVATRGRTGAVDFLPALAGVGSPHHDPTARGALLGVSLDTTPADIVRAVVEGIADRVAELAVHMGVDSLVVDGGLSQSEALLDAIRARDVAVTRPPDVEATLRGAAIVTGRR